MARTPRWVTSKGLTVPEGVQVSPRLPLPTRLGAPVLETLVTTFVSASRTHRLPHVEGSSQTGFHASRSDLPWRAARLAVDHPRRHRLLPREPCRDQHVSARPSGGRPSTRNLDHRDGRGDRLGNLGNPLHCNARLRSGPCHHLRDRPDRLVAHRGRAGHWGGPRLCDLRYDLGECADRWGDRRRRCRVHALPRHVRRDHARCHCVGARSGDRLDRLRHGVRRRSARDCDSRRPDPGRSSRPLS